MKVYQVQVSYGKWNHSYRMVACSSCGAILKAMGTYGERVRISAKPA